MNDRSDENIVAACRGGDKNAYAALVRRHYKQVFLVCLGMLGSVHDAEDIAQETMLKGFTEIRQLRDGKQFGSWSIRIARNLCINFIHRRDRTKKATAEKATRASRDATENDRLEKAIKRLPQKIRLPLTMYYFDGESVKSVAEKLNMSCSTVYLKLQTATRELHEMLIEQGEKND